MVCWQCSQFAQFDACFAGDGIIGLRSMTQLQGDFTPGRDQRECCKDVMAG
jgi:hypothetical protein